MTRRPVLAGLVLVLGVPVTMVLAAPAALACSCVAAGLATQVERSDVVFVGRVIDRAEASPRDVVTSAEPLTWTFTVESVHQGCGGRTAGRRGRPLGGVVRCRVRGGADVPRSR